MNGSDLISIIVPVYNSERFLERCINSLINQSYRHLEIVLVDDGSNDKSPQICDIYSKKYANVKVVHKKNGGLSSARNAGLDVVSGKYIGFIDSDDWVALDAYEYLHKLIIENSAEVAQIEYAMVYSENDNVQNSTEKIVIFHEKDILQYYMASTTISGSYSVCRCLFLRSLVEEIRFREGKINEDIDFKYKTLSSCKTLVVSNLYKYFYYQEHNSLSTGGLKKRDFDLYEAAEVLCDLTKYETYGTIRQLAEVKKARTAFSLLSKIAYYGYSDNSHDKEIERELIKEHRKNTKYLLKAPIPMSRKVLSVMYFVNFDISKLLLKLFRKIRN